MDEKIIVSGYTDKPTGDGIAYGSGGVNPIKGVLVKTGQGYREVTQEELDKQAQHEKEFPKEVRIFFVNYAEKQFLKGVKNGRKKREEEISEYVHSLWKKNNPTLKEEEDGFDEYTLGIRHACASIVSFIERTKPKRMYTGGGGGSVKEEKIDKNITTYKKHG